MPYNQSNANQLSGHTDLRSSPSQTQEANLRTLLRDEEGFLRRAGARELTQAVLYFRAMASKANTPQARDFYLDRATQFSMRAMSGGVYGGTRHSTRRTMN